MKYRVRLSLCDNCNRVLTVFDNKTVRYRHGKKCFSTTLTDIGNWK